MKKKKVFILFIILVAIISILLIVKGKLIEAKYNYKIDQISEYNYFILKQNDQYGVIDNSGKIIIDAKYQNIVIPNPEKDLFVCYTDNSSTVLNSKNEELFKEYELVEPIKLKNVASPLSFEKSVLKYKKNNFYGLIDFNGKVIVKNIYNSIENLQPVEGKLLVKKDDKFGVIDIKGNLMIKTKYDNILSDEYYTKENLYKKSGFIVSNKTENGYKYGYYSYKGKKILNTIYSDISRVSVENDNKNVYLIVGDNGKYGVYKNSKKIIKNDYQSISYDDGINLFLVERNKKYGAFSIQGKSIIEVKNDNLESRGIYLYTKNANDTNVYDSNGNQVNINYNKSIYNTENDEYKISTILNNDITYYGIINKNGTQLIEEKYRYLEYLYGNYFIAKDDSDHLGVINSNGKVLLDLKYESLQKIRNKNLLQSISNNTTEIYSDNLKLITSMANANVTSSENYVLIYNDLERIYLDHNGNEIKDESKIKNLDFPENLGSYKKIQSTLEIVYYEKE